MKRGRWAAARYDRISPGGWDLGYLVYSDEDGKIWVRWYHWKMEGKEHTEVESNNNMLGGRF